MARPFRVFVDANILIRGVTFPRYPFEILRLAARRMIVCVVSPSVLADARHYLSLLFPGHLPKLDGFRQSAKAWRELIAPGKVMRFALFSVLSSLRSR